MTALPVHDKLLDPPEALTLAGLAVKLPIAGSAVPTATVAVSVAGVVPLTPDAVRMKVYVTPVAPLVLGSVTVALVLVARSTLPL